MFGEYARLLSLLFGALIYTVVFFEIISDFFEIPKNSQDLLKTRGFLQEFIVKSQRKNHRFELYVSDDPRMYQVPGDLFFTANPEKFSEQSKIGDAIEIGFLRSRRFWMDFNFIYDLKVGDVRYLSGDQSISEMRAGSILFIFFFSPIIFVIFFIGIIKQVGNIRTLEAGRSVT